MKNLWIILTAVVLLSACTQSTPSDPEPSTPAPVITDTLPNTTILTTVTIEPIGVVVVNGDEKPLYVYVPDADSETSTCNVLCPGVYTPVMADDTVVAQGGLDDDLVGVGGDGQVLYNKHLLYTFSGDTSVIPSGVTSDFVLISVGGSVRTSL